MKDGGFKLIPGVDGPNSCHDMHFICVSNLTPTRFSPFQFHRVSVFVSCLTPDDMFVPGSPFPVKFNSLFALDTLP